MFENAIKNRYEFVILFDVVNGNPNGDPDAGNMPRIDPETNTGIITDVCIKRKIRNYVEAAKEGVPGYRIYIKEDVPLNRADKEAYDYLKIDEKNVKDAKKKDADIDSKIRDFMCRNFFDIRTLTRMAITTEADAEKKSNEMGRKYIVPYGLYRCEGYVSANLARKTTGFSEEDLRLLWEAILNMFETDRSAARGNMAVKELIVFRHDSELGNAPAWKLFETVKVRRREEVDVARKYSDYEVTVDEASVPSGVTVKRMG